MFRLILIVLAGALIASLATAAVTVVADGRPAAVIVVPDTALPVEAYAAAELAAHVEKATGAVLAVVKEADAPAAPASRIYVGNTLAARGAGLEGAKLAPEEFVLRTAPKALYIVGHDSEGEALSYMTFAGTLFGVYQLMEDQLKVKWLWPGELGTVVPKARSLVIPELNKTVAPQLVQRNLRTAIGMRNAGVEGGFSPEAEAVARRDEAVFLRRHRGGKSLRLRYGHAFTNWWERYGKEHPDWFQMIDGKRPDGPTRGDRISMCVSNPGFHQQHNY